VLQLSGCVAQPAAGYDGVIANKSRQLQLNEGPVRWLAGQYFALVRADMLRRTSP
jgi:hypothetical protein